VRTLDDEVKPIIEAYRLLTEGAGGLLTGVAPSVTIP
jgi:hypothetical protein